MSIKIHYEIGIDMGDDGTMSDSFGDNLAEGIKELLEHSDSTAFLDLWSDNTPLDLTLTQRELKQIIGAQ